MKLPSRPVTQAASRDHERHHAGIVVSTQRAIGDLLRRIVNLTSTLDAESMQDRLEYLSDW